MGLPERGFALIEPLVVTAITPARKTIVPARRASEPRTRWASGRDAAFDPPYGGFSYTLECIAGEFPPSGLASESAVPVKAWLGWDVHGRLPPVSRSKELARPAILHSIP
jgi:hypothetical protein